MKKGFTLLELLAVIAILGLISAIAVPVYMGVSESMRENIYNTKINDVLSKSEKFAEDTGRVVFDIRTLIENGYLSADNELGEYKNPVTDRDMGCDIINVIYTDGFYQANLTESNTCYDAEEMESIYGTVELYWVNKNGEEIEKDSNWKKEDYIKVKYRLREGYENLKIDSLDWSGLESIHCNKEDLESERCTEYPVEVNENSIRNVEVHLQVKLKINETEIISNASTRIQLDVQRPVVLDGSVTVDNDIQTSGKRRVEFEITDGSGSGVAGYQLVTTLTSNTCEKVSDYKSATEGIQTEYLEDANTYYICVKDKVGNVTSDLDLTNPRNQIVVENTDKNLPTISRIEITSKEVGCSTIDANVKIDASDEGSTEGLKICVSESQYLNNCSWVDYHENYTISYTFSGTYEQPNRILYVSVMDAAGNIVNRQQAYKLVECYTGVPNRTYPTNTDVDYAGIKWVVMKDNGSSLLLVSKYNVTTMAMSNSTVYSWSSAQARNWLINTWINNNQVLKKDYANGLVAMSFSDGASSYNEKIRLLTKDESNSYPNGSGTPFWSITKNGNNVWYSLTNGAKSYTTYSIGTSTCYSGRSKDVYRITTSRNVANTSSASTISAPNKTTVPSANETVSQTSVGNCYSTYRSYDDCTEQCESCNCWTGCHGSHCGPGLEDSVCDVCETYCSTCCTSDCNFGGYTGSGTYYTKYNYTINRPTAAIGVRPVITVKKRYNY